MLWGVSMGCRKFLSIASAMAFLGLAMLWAPQASAITIVFDPDIVGLPSPTTSQASAVFSGTESGEGVVTIGGTAPVLLTLSLETAGVTDGTFGFAFGDVPDADVGDIDVFFASPLSGLVSETITLAAGDAVTVIFDAVAAGTGFVLFTADVEVVPLPASGLMLLSALGLIALRRRIAR